MQANLGSRFYNLDNLGNGQDYNSGRYNITFNVGVANVSFGVPIIDDQIFEEDELFILGLCSLPNSVIIGNFSQATVTILNDDSKYLSLIFVNIKPYEYYSMYIQSNRISKKVAFRIYTPPNAP